jgi:ankyrin repeat protein
MILITYFLKYVKKRNENMFYYLIEHGAVTDINKECFRNEIPLHKACRGGNENIVKYLV